MSAKRRALSATPPPGGPGGSDADRQRDAGDPSEVGRGWERWLALAEASEVLEPADVALATRLCRLADTENGLAVLTAALCVRGLRLGHVCLDLRRPPDLVGEEAMTEPVPPLSPLPDPIRWAAHLVRCGLASPSVPTPEPGAGMGHGPRPLQLDGPLAYLTRYWALERSVAAALVERGRRAGSRPSLGVSRGGPADRGAPPDAAGERARRVDLAALLRRRFPEGGVGLRAGSLVASSRLAVVAGGPGTGKTTLVAHILGLLADVESAAGEPAPRIALAAPTGKAAARLEESVHVAAGRLGEDDPARTLLGELAATTVHRLLGASRGGRPGSGRAGPLPHDVVVVDEASMLSLSLIAELLDALRPAARLVLVGDPNQLASIEAGAVLGDIVGPVADDQGGSAADEPPAPLQEARGGDPAAPGDPALPGDPAGLQAPAEPNGDRDGPVQPGLAGQVVVLQRVYRFGGRLAELARAVSRGDPDAVVSLLAGGPDGALSWYPLELSEAREAELGALRDEVVASLGHLHQLAAAGDAAATLSARSELCVLCAHRKGIFGVSGWTERIETWLAAAIPGYGLGRFYVGRPLLVTANDYEARLFNGDTGVVVRGRQGEPVAVFARGPEIITRSPARLGDVETAHALTVHKSQGSQFASVVFVLPPVGSPLLSRQLLYTAITRAEQRVTLVGTEAALRRAVETPITRATGLRARLWDGRGSA